MKAWDHGLLPLPPAGGFSRMGHWNECGYRVENPSVDTGISSTCDRLHGSTEAGAVGNAKLVDGSFKMLAQVLLIATLPSMFCAGCATFLAYKERKQWVWFAGLSILAGIGGITILNMIGLWRLAGH